MFSRNSASTGAGSPRVVGFYEEATGSVQYVVIDEATKACALIDVVLDFDPAHARTSTESAEEIRNFVRDEGLTVEWVLDTHPHADHLMASAWLREKTGAPNAIGKKVGEIAALWTEYYNLSDAFDPQRDFDRLFAHGDRFKIGELDARVMLCPGHTLGSVTYVIGNAAFVHDTFMHVDSGTARADFPGGSSAVLYRSLMAILDLPDNTRLFIGHDYPPVGSRKNPAWEATVAEHRAKNVHVGGGVSEEDFCRLRDKRDATLALPERMLHALQVNLRGGRLPEPEEDGQSYFKIPANRFLRSLDMKIEEIGGATLETWSVDEVAEAYARNEIALIDVRTPQEYMFEHIEGAMLLPMAFVSSDKLPAQEGKRLVFYCGSSARSGKVARQCLQNGMRPVAHMDGGFGAWKAAGKAHIGTDMGTGAPKRVEAKSG